MPTLIHWTVMLIIFFSVRLFVGSVWSLGFYIPATTANDLRLRKDFLFQILPIAIICINNTNYNNTNVNDDNDDRNNNMFMIFSMMIISTTASTTTTPPPTHLWHLQWLLSQQQQENCWKRRMLPKWLLSIRGRTCNPTPLVHQDMTKKTNILKKER